MSFFRKKQSAEGKARTEAQMELAQTSPSDVVDLSDCDLDKVPEGVYALTKVLRKSAILLHSNRLRSLRERHASDLIDLAKLSDSLRILDLHDNDLRELPSEVGSLARLQLLNLSGNALRKLPDALAQCCSLQTLNLRDNQLTEVPCWIDKLKSLRQLDLRGNRIRELPCEVGRLACLETLRLDEAQMSFPSSATCAKGSEAVMRCLCATEGRDYTPPGAEQILPLLNNPGDVTDGCRKASSVAAEMEALARTAAQAAEAKEQKRKDAAQFAQDILDAQSHAAAQIASTTGTRHRLLHQLSREQKEMEARLQGIQARKDSDQQQLIGAIEEMEAHASSLIGQILAVNGEARRRETLLEAEEELKMRDDQFFRVRLEEYERLRKAETEAAMGAMMAAQFGLAELVELRDRERESQLNSVLEAEAASRTDLKGLLADKDNAADKLLAQLCEDQDFQKKALLRLMEDRDARFNRVNDQIALLQDELAQVTLLEMENRDNRAGENSLVLESQRVELTRLLLQLMEEKAARGRELSNRLVEMEAAREDSQVDYWLAQYQRLMDHKPTLQISREQEMDMEVRKVLSQAEADDFLPAFTRHRITSQTLPNLNEEDLQSIGIYQVGVRKRLLEAIARYAPSKKLSQPSKSLAKDGQDSKDAKPSAPSAPALPSSSGEPTGHPRTAQIEARFEAECVVCLSRKSELIFVPCGHVCCCADCGGGLDLCPLCRGGVEHRVHLTLQPNLALNLTL